MPSAPNKALVQVLKKIPLFRDLSPSQIQKVLAVCSAKSYCANEVICGKGSSGDEMYILLSGQLAIKKPDGLLITTLSPVTTVGEMGMVTRQPRNVLIEATSPSSLLAIKRARFDLLLKNDIDMPVKIYRNVILMLSNRFIQENVRISDFYREKEKNKVLKEKLVVAKEMLAEKGMSRAEIEANISGKMREKMPQILVVDDEPIILNVMRKLLAAYNVREGTSGEEALELVHQEMPDLVITDINMPGMGGMGLFKSLKTKYPDLPVVGLSGYVDPERVPSLGFDGFLHKPVSATLLRIQVEAHIRKKAI